MTSEAAPIRSAVVAHGRVLEEQGGRVPVPLWSFTKTVIATAALALVRDGALRLDGPLADQGWTLRQLLQHRAGLGDYGHLPAYHEAVAAGDDPWPSDRLIERVEAANARAAPGTSWTYSNVGYLLVRRLIEAATGQNLAAALPTLVIGPLGADSLRLAQSPGDLAGVDMGGIAPYHPGWVYHGLLVGTLADAALLLDRLIAGAFLPPHLLAAMGEPVRLPGPVPGRPWAEPAYGLGLMLGTNTYGAAVLGHTGGGPGSVCAVYNCPATSKTAATFAPEDDPARVEDAAFRLAMR